MANPLDAAWAVLKSEKSRQRAERRAWRRQENLENSRKQDRLKQHTDWEAGRDQRQAEYEEALAAWEAEVAAKKERDDAMNRPERRAAAAEQQRQAERDRLKNPDQRARELIEASRTKVVDDPMAWRPQPPPDVNPFE